ncbi:MAG: PLP-dependent aminotransferase family protein [Cyanobacteria bacterium]|nr:PLP-dependent aminotransferase family protein [Cyanobacteriota bacterium]
MQGTLKQGDRVPSIRKMKEQMKVSVSTVQQAYSLLESRGLIEAHPQSGYYVRLNFHALLPEPNISQKDVSATNLEINRLVASYFEVATHHTDAFLSFGTAAPETALLPMNELMRSVKASLPKIEEYGLGYDFPPGHRELRRQLAIRSIDSGFSFLPDNIVITSGTLEAFNLCLKVLTKPGDIVAIESPTYFGILQTIEHLGLRAIEIPTHPRTGIDLKLLGKALKDNKISTCLLVPNFSNPLGSLMPDDKKEELIRLLEKHDVPLIEDDVYGDIHFQVKRPKPVKAFDRKGLVLLCSSFSKSLAPGFRVGWVEPGRYLKEVLHMKFMTSISSSILPQIALAQFLESGDYDRHLRNYRRTLYLNSMKMAQAITQYFPKGTHMTHPQGGIVTWIELPKGVDSVLLHQLALTKSILVSPGVIFSANSSYKNCIRLNFAFIWTEAANRAIREIGKLTRVALEK